MRRVIWGLAVVVVTGFVGVPGGFAAPRVGGEVFGAYNTHAMNNVNDGIEATNLSLGTSFEELTGGITGGLSIRVWPTGSWMLSGTWEPIFLETKDSATDSRITANANAIQVSAVYFLPSLVPAKYGFGAGVGYYLLNGESEFPPSPVVKTEGSGTGFHLMGMAELPVSPGFAVTGAAGWRWADIEIDNSSPTTTANYTGFMGRVGLAFYLPTP